MATIFDVGRRAGVSRSTVSRVLNGKGEVDPKTAEHVWKAVRELNYHPNASARALVRQRTDMIGVMLANISDPFYTQIIKGIEAAAAACSLGVAFYNSDDDLQNHKLLISSLLESNQVDGLIVVGSHLGDKQMILELINRGFPMAMIERLFSDSRVPCVVADNYGGAALAVEHLIKLGHRRIGCITGNLHYQTAIERLEGYKQTLTKNGLSVDEDLIALGDFHYETGYEGMKQLLLLKDRPSAVFICNDMMAFGAIRASEGFGLNIPRDLAVVGYDDIEFMSKLYPRLTTVRQPLFNMGLLAAQGLIERIGPEGNDPSLKKVFPVQLIVRGSCGAIPDGG